MPINKQSYPVSGEGQYVQRPHNLQKWMDTVYQVFGDMNQGLSFFEAFEKATQGWNKGEKRDFRHWIDFYQSGAHLKYKTAQEYYQLNGDGPPVIPMDHLSAKMPGYQKPHSDKSQDKIDRELKELEEKKKQQEAEARKAELRKKIISRLQAAEKIVTDPEAQKDLLNAVDMGLPKWLETLHSLKRSIQTAPMRSSASPILYDLIAKQGNQLSDQGYPKTGKLLTKLAQEAQEQVQVPVEEDEGFEDGDEAMKDFVRRMNNEVLEDKEDFSEADDESTITVEAQEAPRPEPSPQDEKDIPTLEEPAELEVEEELEEQDQIANVSKEVEPSDLLENVTVKDVIMKLESIADILRKRELPRQLALADLMMDELGISGFFPTLAEAHRSALDSNGYMITRIDDILSKLRGAVDIVNPIHLTTTPQERSDTTDTLEQVRHSLEKAEEAEKARREKNKKKRQQKEQQEMEQQQAEEELSKPITVQEGTPPRTT